MVEASRDFVCIRLATYENQQEADFMAQLYTGKSGNVENTTFVILAPDGKTKLTRAGRGPFVSYRDGDSMARGLTTIAKKYSSKSTSGHAALPYAESVRLGLNLAASDNQPLAIVFASDSDSRKSLEAKLLPLSWQEPAVGKFVYAVCSDASDLKSIEGLPSGNSQADGILLIEPDKFGQAGTLVSDLLADADAIEIKSQMANVAENFKRIKKDHRSHVKAGIDQGIEWTAKIQVTDAQAEAARERMRGGQGERQRGKNNAEGRQRRPEQARAGTATDQFVNRAMTFDQDGDGKLDRNELEALANAMMSRNQGRAEGPSEGRRADGRNQGRAQGRGEGPRAQGRNNGRPPRGRGESGRRPPPPGNERGGRPPGQGR